VLVVAYFDRLVRSLRVQQEIVDRVEAAGGKVLTADLGQVSNGTAIKRLSGGVLGLMNEYIAESARERSIEGTSEAIAQGKVPGRLIPGLRRHGGTVELDPEHADAVREAFQLRVEGKSVREVRLQLAERGIRRSYHAVRDMLVNEQAVGVLKYGDHRIEIPRLVDDDTFRRARRVSAPPGKQTKSQRLLARLGVLRCATCGARMVVAQTNHGRTWSYRCPPTGGDCPRRMSISADMVETAVVEYVKQAVHGLQGIANARSELEHAALAVEQAERAYKAAVAALDPAEPVEVQRLAEFRQAREEARDAYDRARVGLEATGGFAIKGGDWIALTMAEQRSLITRVLEAVVIHPADEFGPGRDRIRFEPRRST
jgi:hypothetical protein